ncbi:hypothetical protein [Kribbia dieselivorans]|uniref:hypothetical protein n=1 Tax=Kribbia dieselivorans TaxID=331526 RepID=UPI000838A369|nr:hypothetical protein [Kribbia dieselivorans]
MKTWMGADTPMSAVITVTAAVAVALLAVLGVGSWYADDLDFLIHGTEGFSARALLTPVNDHVAPGLRFAYAVLAMGGLPSYGVTIVGRLIMWAMAVVLMAGLARRIVDRPWAGPVAAVLYGFSVLALPSTASLSSAVNNLPSHVLILVALHATLDWFAGRRWWRLIVVAVALVVAMAFWELSALMVLTAAGLVMYRYGPAALFRTRRGWVYIGVVAVAGLSFTALYLSATATTGGDWPGLSDLAGVVAHTFARIVLPAFVGGPWRWIAPPPQWLGLANPPWWVTLLGGAFAAVLCLAALRRRPSVAWLWAALLLHTVMASVVLAFGRFAGFGDLMTRHHHYWSALAVPFTLVVVASVAAAWPADHPRWARRLVAGAAVVWTIGTVVSWATFAVPWSHNPSGTYLATLRLETAAPGVNLWDTRPPLDVMPYISDHRSVVSLARLMGNDPASMVGTSDPVLADDAGKLQLAGLRAWGTVKVPPDCEVNLRGETSQRLRIAGSPPDGEWFIRIGYLATSDSTVDVHVDGAGPDGRPATIGTGGPRQWDGGVGRVNLRVDTVSTPRTISITSSTPNAQICIGDITVGQPEPLR